MGAKSNPVKTDYPKFIPLDVLKELKKEEVAKARWIYVNSGATIKLSDGLDYTFDTDDSAKIAISGLVNYLMLDQTYECDWKLQNGSLVHLKPQDIMILANSIRVFVQECFDKEKELSNEIDNSNDVEKIKQIKWKFR